MSEYILKTRDNGTTIQVKDVQRVLLDILGELDRICIKHNIEYFLAFGSCLGAIRHQGFIPWDDDLDVIMNYENYFKLLAALSSDLNPDYYFQCYENDPCYNVLVPTMKIRKRGTYIKEANSLIRNRCLSGDGIFLDVFIFDSMAPKKSTHLFHRFFSSLLMPPIVLLENLNINPVFLKNLMVKYDYWYAQKFKDSLDTYFTLRWTWDGFKDKRINKSDLFPTIRVPFEDGMYPVPNNYDKYLSIAYSPSYMTPPPEGNRYAKHIVDIEIEE